LTTTILQYDAKVEQEAAFFTVLILFVTLAAATQTPVTAAKQAVSCTATSPLIQSLKCPSTRFNFTLFQWQADKINMQYNEKIIF